jgi:hypothetical protein
MKEPFWKRNWIEILAVLAILFAVAMFVYNYLPRGSADPYAPNPILIWLSSLEQSILSIPLPYLAAAVLGIGGASALFWSLRRRYLNSAAWRSTNCPKCNSRLRRSRRSSWDRFLGVTLLPHSRRYRCVEPACNWTGLRDHAHHLRSAFDEDPTQPFSLSDPAD